MSATKSGELVPIDLAFSIEAARLHARAIEESLASVSDPETLRRGREDLARFQTRVAHLEQVRALTALCLEGAASEQRLAMAVHALLNRKDTPISN